jgi:metal-responsive CopG/Arc/MetJ family transcriptional regulator
METTISIILPEEIRAALDAVTRKEGVSPNELVSEAVKEYLFFRRLRLLRERMVDKAKTQGIRTDQDVFDRVS